VSGTLVELDTDDKKIVVEDVEGEKAVYDLAERFEMPDEEYIIKCIGSTVELVLEDSTVVRFYKS
jgi:hypothetical protein